MTPCDVPLPDGSSEAARRLARLRAGPIPLWLAVTLGILTAAGPISTDAYLPAFPVMERSLHAAAGAAQLTLAAWFAGLGCGQIVQGPLSDRHGRRAPLIAGSAVFTLASVGCALAPTITTMCVFRFLAALGASAAAVVPRAVVRDLRDGHEARRLMAQLMLVMGVVPILAPSVGGVLLTVASWRLIFWMTAAFGLLSLGLASRVLPETLPPDRRLRVRPGDQFARYVQIGLERSFITNGLVGGLSLFSLFAYLGGSPAAYVRQYGLSPAQYAVAFSVNAVVFIGAAQLTVPLTHRFGVGRVVGAGTSYMLGATGFLLLVASTGLGHLPLLVVSIGLCLAGLGVIAPLTPVAALSRHSAHAGSASALLGTLQYALGALAAFGVGALEDGTARPFAAMMVVGAVCAKGIHLLRPRDGGHE
jgi:MFS transporter, DHA1 family, multidrug resistance protein